MDGSVSSTGALQRLEGVIRGIGPAITAFSGGVDSTLVAFVSARVHGSSALAVTGISPSLSKREQEDAVALAARLELAHECIDTDEMSRRGYRQNAGDRCFHCKSELFERLQQLAQRRGLATVLAGDNLDDLGDHRPGMVAGDEFGVRKPLIEARLGKREVRAVARELGLPNHDKPAAPCLASRVPYGTTVEPEVLARIERAEARVRELGFVVFRVRHHGELARLEVAVDELPRALDARVALVAALKGAGYRWACVDLAGFRSGSLNVVLGGDEGAGDA